MTTRDLKPDDEVPFLDPEPPPLVARSLAWLLIGIAIAGALLAATVQIPESVSVPFVLTPKRGTDPVRAPRSGVVARVALSEGVSVAKGDSLFGIRSSEFGDRSAERDTLEAQLPGSAQSLANARRKHESERGASAAELRSLRDKVGALERMVALKKQQVGNSHEQVTRARTLVDQGLISQNELADALIKRDQTVVDAEQLESEQHTTEGAIKKLLDQDAAREAEFQELTRSTLEKEAQMRIRLEALKREPAAGPGGELDVRSPCAGSVVRLNVRAAGAVLHEGDVLAEVACSDETLRAALDLPQRALARVQAGQPVKLLFDAFPYQRYGVARGSVIWAAPSGTAAAATGAASTFPVLVELEDTSLFADGRRISFVAGMRGTARIVVARRTLIGHAFEPLRQLREELK